MSFVHFAVSAKTICTDQSVNDLPEGERWVTDESILSDTDVTCPGCGNKLPAYRKFAARKRELIKKAPTGFGYDPADVQQAQDQVESALKAAKAN